MPKQLNIIITDDEAAKLEKLRKKHKDGPSLQGLAREMFKQALATVMVDKVKRRAR